MDITVEVIKELASILTTHKLDRLKLGDLELSKTRHEVAREGNSVNQIPSEDEILFWSTSAPPLPKKGGK